MKRRYDSRRRRDAARRTRRDILEAALKLHWEGITEFGPLAREAGCSEATVRKHFPTKEALFRDCTRTFAESLDPPDLASISAIDDPGRRLEEAVSELCRIHEAMFGYAWHSAHLRRDSPTLDAEMSAYEGLADAVASIIAPAGPPGVRGFLDFLTYRALRLSGGLGPRDTRDQIAATLRAILFGGSDPTDPSPTTHESEP